MDAGLIFAAGSGGDGNGGLWVVVALITACTGLLAALTSLLTALRKAWRREDAEPEDHQELDDLIDLLLAERERRRRHRGED